MIQANKVVDISLKSLMSHRSDDNKEKINVSQSILSTVHQLEVIIDVIIWDSITMQIDEFI